MGGVRTIGRAVEVRRVAIGPAIQRDQRAATGSVGRTQRRGAIAVAVKIGIGAQRERPRNNTRRIDAGSRLAAAASKRATQLPGPQIESCRRASVDGATLATFRTQRQTALTAAPREDLHHSSDRRRPIHAGQVASHDLDAIDRVERDPADRRRPAGARIQSHTVDQHQHLRRVRAAQEQRCGRAAPAGLRELHAGFPAEHRYEFDRLPSIDVGPRNDRCGRQRVIDRLRLAGGSDDREGQLRHRL